MTILRFSIPVLLATSILMSSCKKTDKTPAAEPAGSAGATGSAGSAGSAAPAAPPAALPPAAQAQPSAPTAPATGGTGVVPAATLAAIELPKPKGAPAKGMWSQATPIVDGDRYENFIDGDDYWIAVHFIDCNLPAAKEAASKPAADRGSFTFCSDQPTSKLKDYSLFSPSDVARAVKVGHLVILAMLGATGETKLTTTDLEGFLGSLDLAALAKL